MRLKDKVAIITGAGRGIGLAGAVLFAREGAKTVIAEINEDLGRRAEAGIRKAGGEASFVKTDVSSPQAVAALMARTRELYGGLHVLYNNASVYLRGQDGMITDIADETWSRVLAINLNSVFLCCKHGIPLMVESGGGSIINTSSSAGLIGNKMADAYTATKGATISLTRTLATEYGPQGIRVNCICPAGIATEMVKESSLKRSDFDAQAFFDKVPLGRFGEPEEVAQLALFLASDDSSYITAAIIPADGGITITPISG